MRVIAFVACCLLLLARPTAAQPLTLEEVLAFANQPHPDLDLARAQQELAEAERHFAASLNDLRITLEANLRTGRNALYDYAFHPDHAARLNARMTLWDGGRQQAQVAAADLEAAARGLQFADARAHRRLALMTRFFDVLLADQRYAADNEFMAVAYVRWDDGRDRQRVGQITQPELAELEARFQELRLRRNEAERQAQERRALLAAAMNRPGDLPGELAEPKLSGNDRPLPEFAALLAALEADNPRLGIHRQLLSASRSRLAALRADDNPSVELEAETAAYTRGSSTRDDLRAGVNLVWPLYTGRRQDARLAREQARFHALQAEYEQLRLELRQRLYETWQEIQMLRQTERRAVEINAQYRELALERARAEYEMELRTNLGNGMAETQAAELRRQSVEYRLALGWARLAVLLGGPVENIKAETAR